jgi:hypothetical protein
VLDVKLPTAQVRRHHCRVLFRTDSVSLAVLFALYVCWRAGEALLNRLIYENDHYAIRVLDTQTDGVVSEEQIRRWAGAKLGDNLFKLDLARIKRDLELVPSIESAAVARLLPQTLRIHVQEREPVAQVLTAVLRDNAPAQNVVYLLDAEGHVMVPLASWQRAVPASDSEQYPVIAGASLAQISPGRRVESPQIRAALRLIAAFDHSPMAGLVELRQIDVSATGVLSVRTEQQSEVALRTQDLERQLIRWRILYDLGLQQGRQIASLDLSVMENIPLRWQDGAVVPPAGPKTKKTSPYKKRHV